MSQDHNTPEFSAQAYTSRNTPDTGEWTQIPFEAKPSVNAARPPAGFVRTPPEESMAPRRKHGRILWLILAVLLLAAAAVYGAVTLYARSQTAALQAMQEQNAALSQQLSDQSQQIADLKLALQAQSTQQIVLESNLDRLTQSVSEFADIDPNIYSTTTNPLPMGGSMTTSQIAASLQPSVVCVREILNADAYNNLYGGWGGISSEDLILSEGSGIVYSSGGKIITNYHVVASAVKGNATLEVLLHDGTSVTATVIGADELTDLALLQANATSLTAAKFGDSETLVVGESALAIGNPLGSELSGSVTSGIISALNRVMDPTNPSMTYIQTDAAINPGNSGGALVNSRGEVIGINSTKISSTEVEGLGFAIPTSIALPVIEQLDEYGKVMGRAELEISAFDITSILAWRYGCPEGICIQSLSSSLLEEGLQVSDIITAADGKVVDSYSDLVRMITTTYKAGDRITLTLYRFHTVSRTFKEIAVEVTLAEA